VFKWVRREFAGCVFEACAMLVPKEMKVEHSGGVKDGGCPMRKKPTLAAAGVKRSDESYSCDLRDINLQSGATSRPLRALC
jgi:hypothetical protein